MLKNKTFWIMLIVCLLSCLALFIHHKTEMLKKDRENKEFITSLNDTINKWKDENGKIHYKISVIETENTKYFLEIQSKDKEIIRLQEVVKEYAKKLKNPGSTATIVGVETKYDTIYDVVEVPIEYAVQDTISNKWMTATYSRILGKVSFSLRVRNDFTIVHGEESQGWFKPSKSFVDIYDNNPHSEVKYLRSYRTSIKKDKHAIGPTINMSINKDLQIQPVIGFGYMYILKSF